MIDAAAPDSEQSPQRRVILCADDFAISDGVSRGIEELAALNRLSATSAIVTLPTWQHHAPHLSALRPRLAIGLHLNLTLGAPTGSMPRLAPDNRLPSMRRLTAWSLSGKIDRSEIAAEVGRQLARFAADTGHEPDFIDGHQHAHALPAVRAGLVRALIERYDTAPEHPTEHPTEPPPVRPLVRDPCDSLSTIFQRRVAVTKAASINALATGFRDLVRGAGFATNDTFAGVTSFSTRGKFATELAAFMRAAGACHIVMCHPGYPDAELAALDPVLERRHHELETLSSLPGLPEKIWHPDRSPGAAGVAWPREATAP